METKAHHVLIGAFTLVVVAAAILFAGWLAKTSISRQYHYYDIVFTEAVTGLSKGSAVQYNGIQVGEVSQLKLDPRDPRKVIARIRVSSDTPIKDDTRAKLGLLGLTGVAFVQLSGGAPGSPSLMPTRTNPVPHIKAESSALTKLLASGADIATNANVLLERLNRIVSPSNVAHLDNTLQHLDQTTAAIADERADIRALIRQTRDASQQLNRTLASANSLIDGPGRKTLASTQATLASLQRTSETLDRLLEENRGNLQSGMEGIGQIGPTLRELRSTLSDLHSLTSKLQGNPAGYLLGREQPTEFEPKR
jgi:phospholipid/cholesterol/gamma-HCH transport system substrate-binding protein